MKSYHQYCALARGLDVLGDRWSMLIIRELSLRDCRYTDIRDGLPGIASNLLAERLRELSHAGVVERYESPKPIASALYRLTLRGRELLPAMHAIVRWASPLMVSGPADGDHERGRWTAFAADAFLGGPGADATTLSVQMGDDEEPIVIDIAAGDVSVRIGTDDHADVRVHGSNWMQLGLLSGELSFSEATRLIEITGSRTAVRKLRGVLHRRRTVGSPIAAVGGR